MHFGLLHLHSYNFLKMHLLLLRVCISATIITIVSCQDILLESSSIKCAVGDAQVVHWRPEPLTFFANKSILIGPHPPESTLSELIHNDIELKLTSKCSTKMLITMKLTSKNYQDEMVKDALVLIERVRNEQTGRTSRLGHPIALKIHQSPTMLLYPFKFLYKVNGKAYEEVINRENSVNFKGCDNEATSKAPTCGPSTLDANGNKIRAGFCCSCDDQRGNRQIRGGQLCNVPKVTDFFKTSAHCLRFSPYWYGVYEILKPKVFHQVQIQIFQSEEASDGSFSWKKLTQKSEMVSPENPEFVTDKMRLIYRLGDPPPDSQYLDITSRLLIPIPNAHQGALEQNTPPPLIGSLGDTVLVVPKSSLAPQGAHCDRIGVSYSAFVNQQSPCKLRLNSCLFNQPFDLWAKDQGGNNNGAEKYKLGSFGPIHQDLPIKMDGETEGRIIMEYQRTGPTYIDIEFVPEIDVLAMSPGYNGIIESVMTDSSGSGVKVISQIGNRELVSTSFAVSVIKCSGGQVTNSKTELKPIGPLGSVTFIVDIKEIKLTDKGSCTLLLMNEYNETIAARRILISPGETCICMDICDCTCGGSSYTCKPLSKENRLAAGIAVDDEGPPNKATTQQPDRISGFSNLILLICIIWFYHWKN